MQHLGLVQKTPFVSGKMCFFQNKTCQLNFNLMNWFPGWGKSGENSDTSDVLQQVQIPVIGNDDCKAKYQKIFRFRQIPDHCLNESSVICAGYEIGGQDTCQGDSGGPMMLPMNENGHFPMYQIGIVSSGLGCARSNTPGMYTNVFRQIDWIENQLY